MILCLPTLEIMNICIQTWLLRSSGNVLQRTVQGIDACHLSKSLRYTNRHSIGANGVKSPRSGRTTIPTNHHSSKECRDQAPILLPYNSKASAILFILLPITMSSSISIPPNMKSLAVNAFKPPADFTILELATPQITSPDHVLIKVLAASLNPTDIALAKGAFKWAVKTP
jgi:hypothetical protein